jgi:acyl carrier protein
MNKFLLLADLSELLEVNIALLHDDYKLDPEGSWDSLAIVSVIGAIDQHYGTQVNGASLACCERVGDVFKLALAQNSMDAA